MPHLHRRTRRLVVRPLRPADYTAWREANSTMLPQRNKWDRKNKLPEDLTKARFREILASQKRLRAQDKFYDLAVFERAGGKLVATVAVMDVLRGLGQSAYVGYFVNNNHWGKGYGKEAVKALLDIGFRDLKLHRLEAGIEPTNRRSILLARSLGMRKEGLKKRAVFLRGRWNDLVMYTLTCEELGHRWRGVPQTRPR